MFSVYQPQSLTDLEALIPFATIMTHLPPGFVPPGVLNPDYNPPDRGPLLFVVTIIMSCITVPIVILRMYLRIRYSGLGSDDKVIVFAAIGICLNSILAILGVVKFGIGYHSYDMTIDKIAGAYGLIQAFVLLYALTIGLTRISILLLIRRLFCENSNNLRLAVHIVMGLCVLFYFSSEAALITQCTPTLATFNIVARIHGRCPNLAAKFYSLSLIHVLLDFAVMILPMRSIWKLQMPLMKRIKLIVVFWMGLLICTFAILRMAYFSKLIESDDINYDALPILLFSQLEISMAIIVSSLPSMNQYITQWLCCCLGDRRRQKSSPSNSRGQNVTIGGYGSSRKKGSRDGDDYDILKDTLPSPYFNSRFPNSPDYEKPLPPLPSIPEEVYTRNKDPSTPKLFRSFNDIRMSYRNSVRPQGYREEACLSPALAYDRPSAYQPASPRFSFTRLSVFSMRSKKKVETQQRQSDELGSAEWARHIKGLLKSYEMSKLTPVHDLERQ